MNQGENVPNSQELKLSQVQMMSSHRWWAERGSQKKMLTVRENESQCFKSLTAQSVAIWLINKDAQARVWCITVLHISLIQQKNLTLKRICYPRINNISGKLLQQDECRNTVCLSSCQKLFSPQIKCCRRTKSRPLTREVIPVTINCTQKSLQIVFFFIVAAVSLFTAALCRWLSWWKLDFSSVSTLLWLEGAIVGILTTFCL